VCGLSDVEVTPLDTGRWTQSLNRRRQWSVAIDDRNHRGGDATDESRPGRVLLLVAPLPVDDVGAGVGDEHAPAVEVGAVEHDLVVDLACRDHSGCHVPAPLSLSCEGASAGSEVASWLGACQPGDEAGEVCLLRRIGALLRRWATAVFAPPARASGTGLAVLDELVSTYTPVGVISGIGQ